MVGVNERCTVHSCLPMPACQARAARKHVHAEHASRDAHLVSRPMCDPTPARNGCLTNIRRSCGGAKDTGSAASTLALPR